MLFEYCPQGGGCVGDSRDIYQPLLFLRKQEEFMNGLFLLYWDGVTDVIAIGHNKLPATAEFVPLEVG